MLGGFREQLTARIYILTSWQCRHSLQSFSATAGKIYSDLGPGRDLCQSITAAEFRSRLHKRAWGIVMNEGKLIVLETRSLKLSMLKLNLTSCLLLSCRMMWGGGSAWSGSRGTWGSIPSSS